MASRAKKKWSWRQRRLTPSPVIQDKLTSAGFDLDKVRFTRLSGRQKVSAVFLDFIEPYTSLHDSMEEFKKSVDLGMLAWNISLSPPAKREEYFSRIAENLKPTQMADLMEILPPMIERKEQYFAHCRRLIMGYEVTPTPAGRHLSVVSTPVQV